MDDITKVTIKKAFLNSLPVMAGYLCLGFGFGILLQSKGYGFGWAMFMSIFIYAGTMQYVAVDLMAGGASLISTALMTLLVNARHLFYGISMLENYGDTGKIKPLLAFLLTDETYSLVCSKELLPEGADKKKYYLFLSLMNQIYWVAGSALGGIIGAAVKFNTTGIEFAMTALFVMIMIEQWETADTHIPAVVGLASSLGCLLIFGPANFLLPSMLSITVILLIFRKPIEKISSKSDDKDGNSKEAKQDV